MLTSNEIRDRIREGLERAMSISPPILDTEAYYKRWDNRQRPAYEIRLPADQYADMRSAVSSDIPYLLNTLQVTADALAEADTPETRRVLDLMWTVLNSDPRSLPPELRPFIEYAAILSR